MNTERIDQALGYAEKWTKRPVVDQSMNGHMQVLAAEVRRRRELDGLVAELIGFARVYAGYPSSRRPLMRGKLAMYDAVSGSALADPGNGSNAGTGTDNGTSHS